MSKDGRLEAGQGSTVNLRFDVRDSRETRALSVAQLMAVVPGRRKEYLITFLSALEEVVFINGQLPDPADISNAIRGLSHRT